MLALLKHHLKPIRYWLLALLIAFTVLACSADSTTVLEGSKTTLANENTANPDAITMLWDKGYVTEEDEAIEKIVADWNAQGNLPIDLSFYNSGEIAPKTLRASQGGISPDILFAAKSVYPVSDWQGKLADVSDIVTPLEDSYTSTALQSAKVYGSETAKGRYYAVPLNQSTTHIYYWKDLLEEAGYTPADIPTEWDEFWTFWQTVQETLQPTYPGLRSIGLPYSEDAFDTYHIFEHVLSAYDVSLVDERGNLLLNDPAVKSDIAKALDWYLQFYRDGYVPKEAVKWLDPENNRNLLDRNVVMTPNPTLSIPAAVRNDSDIYLEKLGTIEFPNKPSGEPLPHLVSIRQAIVFEDAPHVEEAKAFLTYLSQADVLSDFLKTSYGRYMPPALSQIEADSFWQDADDPHVSTVVKTVTDRQTQPFPNVYSPAYGIVMEQNIWGQAIQKMAINEMSAQEAADWATTQIQAIFREHSL
ncbi:MAG: ABC transporter substrate-binding protein [Cyanobacteria bacterium J06634_5]